jgi:hypothetical protein
VHHPAPTDVGKQSTQLLTLSIAGRSQWLVGTTGVLAVSNSLCTGILAYAVDGTERVLAATFEDQHTD